MKVLKAVVAVVLLVTLVLMVDMFSAFFSESIDADTQASTSVESAAEEEVFPHGQVVDVSIEMDEETLESLFENATEETYVVADITYNGYTLNNIAIRAKGNSSLRDVAQIDSERFSFKIDLDKYQEGQNLFGITKLNLNNLFSDSTLMAEYIGYEMLDSIDAVASDTSYVSLTINGEYHGLYLAVEEVNESFLMDNFGNYDGELYKPDMGIGSDLAYISDDPDDYTGIEPQDDDMETDEHWVDLVTTIDKIVENGGETEDYNLSDVLNVDSFLSYLAMSTVTVHMDTIQSGMNHNYYLYYNTDTEVFEWISWDLNMIFNGYPGSTLTDEEATALLIDEPVIGAMSNYPLVEAVFTNESYVEIYHGYMEALINGYLEEDTFETSVLETYTMIESYASIDPTAFYTIDQVQESIFNADDEASISLFEFIELRSENIINQLDGTIASTNDGQGNGGTNSKKSNKGEMAQGMGDASEVQAAGQEKPTDGGRPMPTDGEIPEDSDGEKLESKEGGRPMPTEGEMPEGMEGSRGMMAMEGETPEIGSQEDIIANLLPIGISLVAMGGIIVYLLVRKY